MKVNFRTTTLKQSLRDNSTLQLLKKALEIEAAYKQRVQTQRKEK